MEKDVEGSVPGIIYGIIPMFYGDTEKKHENL
jgi:hypothetical protein